MPILIARNTLLNTLLIIITATSLAIACGTNDQPADTDSDNDDVDQSVRRAAPEFDLPSANTGEQISLAQFRDDQPVVLVFYRAYW